MEHKKIVVLGGGTAGWMTALFCRQTFPSASITVIENTSLGTIGVGEGTTVGFVNFLNSLEIDEFDVMREAKGAIKSGISFENWNGDNKKYFHSFRGQDIFSIQPHFKQGCWEYYYKTLIKEGLDFNEYVYPAKLAYRNELDLYNIPIALHIDTFKLGICLSKAGADRNIVCVDGNFNHVEVDENNFIKKLCLDDGRDFECDFVFDCSGFAKLLIGKYYKVPWVSYKDYLPMKKAIAFNLESEEDIKPYTQAIAMKYGWMWKIPIPDRIGVGYVLDSDYVSDEEAIDEAQQFLGQPISNVRSIPFESGKCEQVWVKNCIAIGLAANFLEPLEATSLDLVTLQLTTLTEFINHFFTYNENSVSMYNEIISAQMDGTSYFIYLHYLTKRKDSEFWQTFQERYPVPQEFEGVLNLIYENNLRERNLLDLKAFQLVGRTLIRPFSLVDYLEICNGLEIFKQPIDMDGYEKLIPSVEEYKERNDANIRNPTSSTKHMDFLAGLHGPERLGSPLGPPCYCDEPGFHRTGPEYKDVIGNI
jgi:tryptophan halogenase|tara:strand:- start:508 stop:2106 length:1599 start_codon:yes stop_codon:yes gene_type:complete